MLDIDSGTSWQLLILTTTGIEMWQQQQMVDQGIVFLEIFMTSTKHLCTVINVRISFRMERKFSKRSKQWCAVKVLKPKEYHYIEQLFLKIFDKRAKSTGGVSQRIGILEEDPIRIAPNISAIPPPSVQSLVEAHQSRF